MSDHLNVVQRSPLVGEAGDDRFVDMSNAYCPRLRAQGGEALGFGQRLRQPPIALDQRKIDHPPQQPPGSRALTITPGGDGVQLVALGGGHAGLVHAELKAIAGHQWLTAWAMPHGNTRLFP